MKKSLLNTLLVLFGLAIGLMVAEVFIRVFYPQDRMVTWLEMHPEGFMMNSANTEAFQEFGERKATYSINSNRLRGAEPDHQKKRVLAIGDSFTFGLLLDQPDTYLNILQEKLDNTGKDSIQILNAGIGGSGLADWPGWLKAYGADIDPDYLVYFLNTEDLERALSKNLYVLQDSSVIKSQRWEPREWMFSLGKQAWYQALQAHSHMFNLLVKVLWAKVYFEDVTNNFDPERSKVAIPEWRELTIQSDYSLRLGKELLQKLNDWCTANNCKLIITTTGYFSMKNPPEHTYRLYEWLKNEKGKFHFFDNTACVDSVAKGGLQSITIPGDSHPDEQGAKIIADCTARRLFDYF